MKGKKEILAKVMRKSGFFNIKSLFSENALTVFNYHRISEKPQLETLFDEENYSCSVDEFEAHLRYLKRNTSILSEAQLIECLDEKKPFPSKSSFITFDDGYKDNYDLAVPLLARHKVPALFFIPTQSIEERKLGWWDVISYLFKKTLLTEFELNENAFLIGSDRILLISHFKDLMKNLPEGQTQDLLVKLSAALRVSLPSEQICDQELMSWEQIKNCQKYQISIGAHTHSHRVLSTLSLADQLEELTLSKSFLEKKLSTPVHTIAYPVGGYEHIHLETYELAKMAGFKAGFTFNTGTNTLPVTQRFDIKRITARKELSLIDGAIHYPSFFAKRGCALSQPRSSIN